MFAIYCTKFEIFCNIYDITAIQFYNISNFAIYCKIIAMHIAIYKPLCRNILQIFYRAIQFLAEPKIHSVLKKNPT